MNETTFKKLPRDFKRRYLAEDVDLTDLDTLQAVARHLLARRVRTLAEFERFAADLFEFRAATGEEYARAYILSTCHTDDAAIKAKEEHLSGTVMPGLAPLQDKLSRKLLRHAEKLSPDPERYRVPIRAWRAGVELFRRRNVPLHTEAHRLCQEYFAIRGAMTVKFDGRERTMSEMHKLLESPDRDLRERAWRARTEKEIAARDRIDELFDRLVELRHRVARNAGFDSFTPYQYQEYRRFDYGPKDCKKLQKAVADHFVPLARRLHEDKIARSGLGKLRPWDLQFDPDGRAPLAPFRDAKELMGRTVELVGKIDPQFGVWAAMMAKRGLLDLTSRKGKAPGGYMSTLAERRLPFIFMNATGTDFDARTILHELGHAFHSLSLRDDALNYAAHMPMEFNEVASMTMELFGCDFIDRFYPDAAEARRSNERLFERIITLLPSVASVDAFQHWVYANPGHTRAERVRQWKACSKRFGTGLVDWSGLEEYQGHGWQNILHIIEVPFYYVEYAIAQLGALQVWRNARKDFPGAVRAYRAGLAAGVGRTLPELYAAAGIRFDFGDALVAALAAELRKARFPAGGGRAKAAGRAKPAGRK